ncbi:MAG TPA: hypothetical protein VF841_00500 [Anaeromyxobacter sp.]
MQKIQLAIAAAALALAGPVRAADTASTQDAEQVRSQVHHTITTQGGVSGQDANDVDAEVSQHAAHAGYGPAIHAAIQAALAETPPCRGTCLVDRIHAINHAMDQGKTPADAAKTAQASGKPSDPQARSEQHRRDMQHRDAAAERVHDRTMDRGQAGSHAMGAGHR